MNDFTFVRNQEGRSTFVFLADPDDDGDYLGEVWKTRDGWTFDDKTYYRTRREAAAQLCNPTKGK